MNDEYIKREDALAAMATWDKFGCDEHGRLVPYTKAYVPYVKFDDMMKAVEGQPSADAALVRHGRWLEYGENKDGTHNMRCSKCGAGLKSKGHANSYYTKHKYRYCQNCGAKMDLLVSGTAADNRKDG